MRALGSVFLKSVTQIYEALYYTFNRLQTLYMLKQLFFKRNRPETKTHSFSFPACDWTIRCRTGGGGGGGGHGNMSLCDKH